MIGVLAGMGPKSTGPFIDIVVEQCQKIYGAKYDIDFPHMMIYSCPTPFYIDREINHLEMENAIINGAKRLEQTGVEFIAMPCNTAHLYIDKIKNSISVPIINMVEETIITIPKSTKRATLLATDSTLQSGIYQDYLLKSKIDFKHNEIWQKTVSGIISNIKNGKLQDARCSWNNLISELSGLVDTVIIACTDLNVISDYKVKGLHFVDSSTCLAKAVVNKFLSKN